MSESEFSELKNFQNLINLLSIFPNSPLTTHHSPLTTHYKACIKVDRLSPCSRLSFLRRR
nr:MAG TPA: hypothetical protein [Caudoviricetes sp.]